MIEKQPSNPNQPLTAEEIWDILHQPMANVHVTQMFAASHYSQQETGFGIYDMGSYYQTSPLLIPEVDQHIDSEEAYRIDMSPLTRQAVCNLENLTQDEVKEDKDPELLHNLLNQRLRLNTEFIPDDTTSKKFLAIADSSELTPGEKLSLIAKLLRRAAQKQEDNNSNVRSDIVLLAHNHPLERESDLALYSYMPSANDLRSYAHVSQASPKHIEAIVSSNGQTDNGMMLYGTPIDATDRNGMANTYEGMAAALDKALTNKEVIAMLGRAGYAATFIPMQFVGTPEPDTFGEVLDFAEALK